MGRKLLHLLNGLITCVVVMALVVAGAYAGYALWDNQQIYDAAENVFSEMKEIKEALGIPATKTALEELLEENRKAREEKAAEAAKDIEGTEMHATTETHAITEEPVSTTLPAVTVEVRASEVPMSEPETSPAAAVTIEPEELAPGTEAERTEENSKTADSVTPEPAGTPGPTEANETTPNLTVEPASEPTPNLTVEPTPEPTEEPDNSLLGQLRAINPGITAWLTLPDTNIDYPVMQGSSNYSYINTDVYGNFALAGSIFLDSRNSKDYTDLYSLVYGHNMSQHRMFSDINLYKDEAFFNEHTLGMLYTEDGWHVLESLSIIVTSASDSGMLNPDNWSILDGEGIYQQAQENALFTCAKGMDALREQLDAGITPRLVSLSTCSDEFTDARTILLTLMDP